MRIACWGLALLSVLPAMAQRSVRIDASDSFLINQAVSAYMRQQYAEAEVMFKKVLAHNPAHVNSHIYLGLCYVARFHPNDLSEANRALAESGERELRNALDLDPDNKNAVHGMGSLALIQGMAAADPKVRREKLDEAADWFRTMIEIDVWSRDGLYNLGFVLFQILEPPFETARGTAIEGEQLRDKTTRTALTAQLGPMLDEAITTMQRCAALDDTYAAPRGYLSQMYRMRASISEDPNAARLDLAQALNWDKKPRPTNP